MTPRELQLAKKAAAALLAVPKSAPPKSARGPKLRNTGAAAAFQARMQAANADYEANKQHGATIAAIERKHGLSRRSLNNWRSYRMTRGTAPIRRTYPNRPTPTRP